MRRDSPPHSMTRFLTTGMTTARVMALASVLATTTLVTYLGFVLNVVERMMVKTATGMAYTTITTLWARASQTKQRCCEVCQWDGHQQTDYNGSRNADHALQAELPSQLKPQDNQHHWYGSLRQQLDWLKDYRRQLYSGHP